MKWFHYSQNNSGGEFKGPANHVLIEAESASDADRRAVDIGLYFDGCDAGLDCSCCGDRWHTAYGDGDDEPEVYGTPAAEYADYWASGSHPSVLVIHADGRREDFTKKKESLF